MIAAFRRIIEKLRIFKRLRRLEQPHTHNINIRQAPGQEVTSSHAPMIDYR